MKDYNFKKLEQKWQKKWEEMDIYEAEDLADEDKYYCLTEFPYPSGSGLHVGHAFSMTGADVYARKKRMSGKNVLFPMGWDAFGLPTANYAVKTGIHPAEATRQNTERFRKQMKKMAFSFDWDREINTTDPKYYKWTQWIFVQLFKHGLAYKDEKPINWCPSCKIGLANEEVIDGNCERCGEEVTKRNISQWIVKITDYADRLLEGLEKVEFVEKVRAAQINWIDRSEGAEVDFDIVDRDEQLKVFTTRPDTLWGATFMVVAPEHELVESLMDNAEIKEYVQKAGRKSDLERAELQKEKTGVFTGLYAVNPVNESKIPIWISDFVLGTYGTGAIMAVPAHDERDFEFAKKYDLPIIPVIEPKEDWDFDKEAYVDVDSGEMINSDFLDGMKPEEAIKRINDWLEKNEFGQRSVNYHLRDWIFSRQHYWGEPIPMVHCEKCGWVPLDEEDLPLELPEVKNYEPTDTGESPLAENEEWVQTECPKCGGDARRETDVMPNWAGSDWYFLRYIDPDNSDTLADMEKMQYWMPVDAYFGGDEHNTLHLLYSRFIYQFLWDIDAVPEGIPEPYYRRISHGVILGTDGARMSKSKGNVIIPDEVASECGVDVLRTYMMFMGPFTGTMAWNSDALKGVERFINRFWNYFVENVKVDSDAVETANGSIDTATKDESSALGTSKTTDESSAGKSESDVGSDEEYEKEVAVLVHKLIDKVTKDIEDFRFNTAIASLMEFLNEVEDKQISIELARKVVQLLAPFAPYITEELWTKLDGKGSVHSSTWPICDQALLQDEKVNLPVQVNGKVRGTIKVAKDISKEELRKKALEMANVKKFIGDKDIKKYIYVPEKIANFVV
jgi:leucyl-tRNA synthetase